MEVRIHKDKLKGRNILDVYFVIKYAVVLFSRLKHHILDLIKHYFQNLPFRTNALDYDDTDDSDDICVGVGRYENDDLDA